MDISSIQSLAAVQLPPFKHFINGESCESSDGKTIKVISPLNGEVLTTMPAGTKEDTERAISHAKASFEEKRWAGLAPSQRKAVMLKWASLIEEHALELAVLGVRNNGTEIGMAYKAEPMSAASTIRYYAEAIDKIYGEIAPTSDSHLGLIHKEPAGVVGVIVPWNFPLMIAAWKLGPALAAGCSVVLKPAETASLTLVRLAELAHQAGIPDGVFNVVTGRGSVVGETISNSMDVDVLVFTGSGNVGRRLLEASAKSNLKRVYLELGGKSPNIVFADSPDLDACVATSANGIFRNSGQVCIAGSRLLVERSIHDEFVIKLKEFVKTMKVGDPLDPTTATGAVNSLSQLEQNLGFVKEAIDAGSTVELGGNRILQETGGFFMEPTIITGVKPDDRLAQQEVFGPVLAVIPFDTEAEAIEIANGTDFGLAAAIWTSNLSRAHRMIREVKAGLVHVNTYGGSDLTVPLGGVKQSGNGHDKSLHAFEKFLDLKTAWIQL